MNSHINPEMVTLAREIRGMTQKELAEKSQVSQAHISRYESDLAIPSKSDLDKLASSLSFPVSFFYQEEKIRGPEASELFHRKQRTISAKDQRRIDGLLNLYRYHSKSILKPFE